MEISKLFTIHEWIRRDQELAGINSSLLSILMLVHMESGITQTDLGVRLHMSQPNVSRNCAKLGGRGTLTGSGKDAGSTGLGLIDLKREDIDARVVNVYLTKKGRTIMNRLMAFLKTQ